jgi:hypothetical protein
MTVGQGIAIAGVWVAVATSSFSIGFWSFIPAIVAWELSKLIIKKGK